MAPCVSTLHSIFSDYMLHVHVGTCTCLFIKKMFPKKLKNTFFSHATSVSPKFWCLTAKRQKLRKSGFFSFWGTCLHKKARACAHMHMGHMARCQPRRRHTHRARKKIEPIRWSEPREIQLQKHVLKTVLMEKIPLTH